jgi:hypothetical protein
METEGVHKNSISVPVLSHKRLRHSGAVTTSHPSSLRSILILSSCLCIQSELLTNVTHVFLASITRSKCHIHFICLDFIALVLQSMNLFIVQFSTAVSAEQ